MIKQTYFFLGLLCLQLFALPAWAQMPGGAGAAGANMPADGVITGRVLEATTKEPIEYANVVLYSTADSSMVTGTVTDVKGYFSLEKVRYGRFYLVADFIGYGKTKIADIGVNPRKLTQSLPDIEIREAAKQLDEVTVVADRAAVDYRIDKKVVNVGQQLNAVGGTVVDALENVPSIQVDAEGNVSMRGSTNFRVLIDGKPSLLEGTEALRQIPADAVENIEIITNPSAKYEPDGTAGIINVILKKRKMEGISAMLNASADIGPSASIGGMVNWRTRGWNLTLGLDYNRRRFGNTSETTRTQWYPDSTTRMVEQGDGNMRFGGNNARLGVEYSFTQNHTLGVEASLNTFLFGRGGITDYHKSNLSTAQHQYYTADNDMEVNGRGLQLNITDALTFGKHQLNFALLGQRNNSERVQRSKTTEAGSDIANLPISDWVNRTAPALRTDLRFNADYVLKINDNSTLEAGMQLRNEESETEYLAQRFDTDKSAWFIIPEESNTVDFRQLISAGYATYSNKIGAYELKLGLRTEYTDRILSQRTTAQEYLYNSLDWFPSAYLSRKIGEQHQLQLNYSRRINRPQVFMLNPFPMGSDAFSIFAGNPNIRPELAASFELNYQFRFGKSYLALESYFRQADDVMTRVSELDNAGIMVSTMRNLNTERRSGAELSGSLVVAPWLTLNPVANLFYYQVTDRASTLATERSSVNWNARLMGTITLAPVSRLQLTAAYNSATVTSLGEFKAFYGFDLAYRHDLMKRQMNLSLRVNDLFRTRRMANTFLGNNYEIDGWMLRQAPFVTVAVSYRFNNFRTKQRPEMDGGGGMEMMR